MVWKVAVGRRDVWCDCVRAYHPRNGDVRTVRATGNQFCGWRCLIKIRDKVCEQLNGKDHALEIICSCVLGDGLVRGKLYHFLRTIGTEKHWARTVWDRLSMPCHSFITWLSSHGRLLA